MGIFSFLRRAFGRKPRATVPNTFPKVRKFVEQSENDLSGEQLAQLAHLIAKDDPTVEDAQAIAEMLGSNDRNADFGLRR